MSNPETEDIRHLMRTVLSELPEADRSSMLSETSVISTLNESSYLRDHKSLVLFKFCH